MKKLFTLFIYFSIANIAISQDFEYDTLFPLNESKKIEYDIVIESNLNKNEIFNLFQEFVDKTYDKSLSDASRMNDREAGLISYKVAFKNPYTKIEEINYKVTIKIKDNKYKLNISNVQFESKDTYLNVRSNGNIAVSKIKCGMDNCNFTFSPKKDWAIFREKVNTYFKEQIELIKKNIKKDNSDW